MLSGDTLSSVLGNRNRSSTFPLEVGRRHSPWVCLFETWVFFGFDADVDCGFLRSAQPRRLAHAPPKSLELGFLTEKKKVWRKKHLDDFSAHFLILNGTFEFNLGQNALQDSGRAQRPIARVGETESTLALSLSRGVRFGACCGDVAVETSVSRWNFSPSVR